MAVCLAGDSMTGCSTRSAVCLPREEAARTCRPSGRFLVTAAISRTRSRLAAVPFRRDDDSLLRQKSRKAAHHEEVDSLFSLRSLKGIKQRGILAAEIRKRHHVHAVGGYVCAGEKKNAPKRQKHFRFDVFPTVSPCRACGRRIFF